jgi:hypothetical protein
MLSRLRLQFPCGLNSSARDRALLRFVCVRVSHLYPIKALEDDILVYQIWVSRWYALLLKFKSVLQASIVIAVTIQD